MESVEEEIKPAKKEEDVLRGQRLKKLRCMTTGSIGEFSKQLGVTRVAVSYWENASCRVLKKARARKVIAFVREQHNIECDFNWLWEGKGPEPRYMHAPSDYPFSSLEKEIELFGEMNSDTVILKIDHGKLSPYFLPGDFVGAIWGVLDALQSDEFCVIHLNGRDEIRWVSKANFQSKEKVQISLTPSAEETEEVSPEKIAPVMRIWRDKNP